MASSDDPNVRIPDGLSSLLLRAATLEHRHNRMLLTIFALAVGLAGSVVMNVWQYTRPEPAPRFFATDETGRILQFLPLDSPLRSGAQVTKFAADVVGCVKNLDAVQAEVQLESCRDYFAPATFKALLDDMQREGVIRAIKAQGAIQDVSPAAPTIEAQGVDMDGRYTYQVEVPVRIGITSGRSAKSYRDGVITLRLRRVDSRMRAEGLVVTGFNEVVRTRIVAPMAPPPPAVPTPMPAANPTVPQP